MAGYRELRGHTDDTDPLGRPPAAGRQAEAYAAYRAAWDTLGRPQVQQAEHEMSNGQHRQRVRAWQREQTIAPRYVGNELAGTRQAEAHHHQTAALRAVEAGNAPDAGDRERTQQEAAQARALAETLDRRVAELEALDDAYIRFRLHSAATRANAEISQQILADRHADADEPEQQITADDWLAAHRAAVADDDRTRPVTADDVDDDRDRHASIDDDTFVTTTDTIEPDLREIAADEPRQAHEDETRVPDADEVADAAQRAWRILHELDARDAYDQQAEEQERAAQLARWHEDEQGDLLDDGAALVREQPSPVAATP